MTLVAWAKTQHKSIHRWLPQGLRDWLNYLIGRAIYYRGEFADWASARNAAKGYDEELLFDRLAHAARAVKAGAAAWEQDGVTRDQVPPDFPLFAALSRVALAKRGQLTVLDFGGALGSSYFQCREFLADVLELNWAIVEQAQLVEIGQKEIASDTLVFFPSIEAALAIRHPDVVLLSSVLQYLEEPWALLEKIIASNIPYLIIDRHPCTFTRELITVQVIPPSLYPASYPSWLFDCPRMLARLEEHYRLLATWDGKDPPIRGWGKGATFKGYFLQRKEKE